MRRGDGVDLHQLDLVARHRRAREDFRDARQQVPGGEREGDQQRPQPRFARDRAQEIFVGEDVGPAEFVERRLALRAGEDARDGLRHVVDRDRLQPRLPAAEHRIGRQLAHEIEHGGDEAAVGAEHHRRAHDHRAGERRLHRLLAFGALAHIERGRGGVGADAGDLDQPFGAGLARGLRNGARGVDVDGVEGVAAVLDIEAHGVDHAPGVHQRRFDRDRVADIGADRLDLRIAVLGPVRMAGGDAHRKAVRAQATDHMPAEEAGAAEYRHDAVVHMRTNGATSEHGDNLRLRSFPRKRESSLLLRSGSPLSRGRAEQLLNSMTGAAVPAVDQLDELLRRQRRLRDAHVERRAAHPRSPRSPRRRSGWSPTSPAPLAPSGLSGEGVSL